VVVDRADPSGVAPLGEADHDITWRRIACRRIACRRVACRRVACRRVACRRVACHRPATVARWLSFPYRRAAVAAVPGVAAVEDDLTHEARTE
jgi:hypothetical protein